MDSFIYQKKILNSVECDLIIDYFNKNKKRHVPGSVSSGQIKDHAKLSTDMGNRFFDETGKFDNEVSKLIADKLTFCVEDYKKTYEGLKYTTPWSLFPFYNIQRYYPTEGYFSAHSENDGNPDTKDRILVWMIYLNTLNFGGGTRFPHYKKTVKAEQGKVVLWPAYWTHLHHGVVHNFKTKYIATGWYSFDKINKDAL